jgi:hypothetical protein
MAADVKPGSSTLLVTLAPHDTAAAEAELRPIAASLHSDTVDEAALEQFKGGEKLLREALAQAADGVTAFTPYNSATRD